MLDQLRKRREENEEGFTLIELMVVVLIIAILIAIAIPTFLGAQDRARDRGAQSDLRNGITAAKTVATDNEGLFKEGATEAAELNSAEPSLDFSASTFGEATIGVGTFISTDNSGNVGTGFRTGLLLQRRSASGTNFCIKATREGEVTFGRDETGAIIGHVGDQASGQTACGATKF